jgi:hypothetical protein
MGKYLDNRVRKTVPFDPRGNFQETGWIQTPQSSNVAAIKPADRHDRNFGVKYRGENMYYFYIPLELQKRIVTIANSGDSVGKFMADHVYGKYQSKKVR